MMDTARVHEAPAESAADRVYAHAKAAILSRSYAPHDLLTEGEIAAAVGVSRTPVREALLRLQADGLVRLLPKRGALVLPVTARELADVLETRRLIETYAVRQAVHQHRTDLVDALRRELDGMRAAARRGDPLDYVHADREFHEALVAATGNEILLSVYRSLRDRQLRMGVANLLGGPGRAPDPARMRANIADHESILAAVSARTLRAAEAAVTAHLDHAEAHLAATS